ncbi:unnamed protein product [Brassicogethes aeneus]|uniref:DUF3730 domain-containing protein n=1 Tax=Brassicogethes aeneus TaxID=1431903 RepID=A0A9P0AZI4_BRAAE|nr:unnamed protein product [Brassicogethes aeneus]
MEILENKLNSNDPIVVAKVISSVVKNIAAKQKSKTENVPELKFLNDKCINNDPLISEVACSGILYLVEADVLDVETVLHDFATKISSVKCFSGVAHLLGELLCLELCKNLEKNNKICQYNLRFPQHPFVTLLHEHVSSWTSIYDEINLIYSRDEKNIVKYRDKLFWPIFLHSICDPGESGIDVLKEKLWRFLINNYTGKELFLDIITWLPIESKANIVLMNEFILESLQSVKNTDLLKILILWQVSALYYLILHKRNPRNILEKLKSIILKEEYQNIANPTIYILTKIIRVCSSVYLECLLNFTKDLLNYFTCDKYSLNALRSSLIHLIANTSLLNNKSVDTAKNIYSYIENNNNKICEFTRDFFASNAKLIVSNSEVYLSVKLTELSSEINLDKFVVSLENTPLYFNKSIIHFLYGVFVQNNPAEVEEKLLEIIIKTAEFAMEISPEILSVVLYKLSKTKHPMLHKKLLESLPKLLIYKENYHKVVATIQVLSKGATRLQNISALLMFEIWKIDDRSYTNLENILLLETPSEDILEFLSTKAFILKEICKIKPEKYGKEIVPHLSNILNKHSGENGDLPCSLAIEGITHLCKAEVIDAVTTWANIYPKFKGDMRIPIINSFCNFIHEIPHLPYADHYPQLIEEVVGTLWHYVILTDNTKIIKVALNGLTSFTLEQISMKIPDDFLDADTLESKESAPSGTPFTIPGKTWVHFLKKVDEKNLTVFGDFLIKMISIEIDNYLKYVYQVKGNNEPINFNGLPLFSIVRGIGEYLKQWLSKWKDLSTSIIYIECLRIFSQEYIKPFPPYNWNFLLELIDDPRVRNYCIDIACHQVILSGSARQIIENLVGTCKNKDDMLCIYKNLRHLANSLQPLTLKPFFETSIKFGISLEKEDSIFLGTILEHLKEVLADKGIQDINKTTISEVLVDIFYNTEKSSKFFVIFMDFAPVLPDKFIENLTSLKCSQVTQEWFEKSVAIRCKIAETNRNSGSPMDLLEEILDVVCGNNLKNATDLTFTHFKQVFHKQIHNTDCALWLLDLIGKIGRKIVANQSEEKHLVYLFDVFILAVVIFSGHSVFLDKENDIFDLFPQAFTSLLLVDHWSICVNQGLEWLYYINSEEYIPKKYRDIFGITLQCFRHHNEFTKNLKWMKWMKLDC